jgi:hypothetical protein
VGRDYCQCRDVERERSSLRVPLGHSGELDEVWDAGSFGNLLDGVNIATGEFTQRLNTNARRGREKIVDYVKECDLFAYGPPPRDEAAQPYGDRLGSLSGSNRLRE